MRSLHLIGTNRKYFAAAWVFTSLNVMIGTWVLYIPFIKNKLALSEGELGLALFFLSFGTLTMIPLAPRIIHSLGAGKTTFFGILLFSLLFQFPLLSADFFWLCATLFLVGTGSSLTDISMNALVSEIEKEDGVNIMSACHGFFSLGGVLGAGIGSLLIVYFPSPPIHMFLVLIGLVVTNLFLFRSYVHTKAPALETGQKSISLSVFRSLGGLGIIALIIMGSEGAIEHWSKLFMQDVAHVTSESLAGFGFVSFSATMTIGRFFGDSLSKRLGAFQLIALGGFTSVIGYVVLRAETGMLSIIGFALIGAGYSVIIPETFRLAGKSKLVSTATGISFVAGIGYLGFLASPALMGFLAEWKNLQFSFTMLLAGAVISTVLGLLLMRK